MVNNSQEKEITAQKNGRVELSVVHKPEGGVVLWETMVQVTQNEADQASVHTMLEDCRTLEP